jgi:hypothetical protein
MRCLPVFTLAALALVAGSACSRGPCTAGDGPVFRVYGPQDSHRLGGTDPLAFSSIQAALDVAEPGSTVCVGQGLWREEIRLEIPEVRLVGSGPELTRLQPLVTTEDPRESLATVLTLLGSDQHVEALRVEGAAVGIHLAPGSSASVVDVELVANQVGLFADDATDLTLEDSRILRNTDVGIHIQSTSRTGPAFFATGIEVAGNGAMDTSLVGGLYSEAPLHIVSSFFRDNTGTEAADLMVKGSFSGQDLRIERTFHTGGAPRIRATGPLWLDATEIALDSATGIEAECAGDALALVNVAISTLATSSAAPPLVMDECQATLVHLTVAHLGPESASAALEASGGDLRIENSAFAGFLEIATGSSPVEEVGSFVGSVLDAALIRPFPTATILRPQHDSPLVDGGISTSLEEDLHGRPRTLGPAPDIGAYERQ